MTKKTLRTALAVAGAAAVLSTGLIAGPAAAAPTAVTADTTSSGTYETQCSQGAVRGSWTRTGTTYTVRIDEYRLLPIDAAVGRTDGQVWVALDGAQSVGRKDLLSDRQWHPLGLTASTQSSGPEGSVMNEFTMTSHGFPTYPTCTVTQML